MKPTLKVLLFWCGVVIAAIAVYEYGDYKGAQSHAAGQESSNAR